MRPRPPSAEILARGGPRLNCAGRAADGRGMRRIAVLLSIAAAVGVAPAAHAATLGGWNRPEQRAVSRAGLLPNLPDGRFHGESPLTGEQLAAALGAVASRAGHPPVAA